MIKQFQKLKQELDDEKEKLKNSAGDQEKMY